MQIQKWIIFVRFLWSPCHETACCFFHFFLIFGGGWNLLRAEAPELIPLSEGMIQNAGSGTEIWNGGESDGLQEIVKTAVRVSPFSCNAMVRLSWAEFEKEEGHYDFSRMDASFRNALKCGQKLNLAVFMTSGVRSFSVNGAFCAYPEYLHRQMQAGAQPDRKFTIPYGSFTQWEPDFQNDLFFERYDALLGAFAQFLEGSVTVGERTVTRRKLVRFIEMRHFGWWGEGAYPKELLPDNSECLIRYVDSYRRHFPSIRLIAPTNGMICSENYRPLLDYHFHLLTARNEAGLFGLFRDNYGWNEDGNYVQALCYDKNLWEKDGVRLVSLLRERWKDAPVTGEPGRWSPDGKYVPYHDLERQALCLRPCVIRNCNVSLGETFTTNANGFDVRKDPVALANFHHFYSIIGFRYVFQTPRLELTENRLKISLNWANSGLTPTYDVWRIRFLLRAPDGQELWSAVSSFDLRTLLPNPDVPPGTLSDFRNVTEVFDFTTSEIPAGSVFFLRIEDPDGISPPMALGIRGRTKTGEYPLPFDGF